MKLLFVSLLFASCLYEVNTSSPQASRTIESSKGNDVFIAEYKSVDDNDSCSKFSAWIEYTWKNKIVDSKKTIERISGTQLVWAFKPDQLGLNKLEFLDSWKIIDSTYGYFSTGNGVFILDLNMSQVPDTFNFVVSKTADSTGNICSVRIIKYFETTN